VVNFDELVYEFLGIDTDKLEKEGREFYKLFEEYLKRSKDA